MTNESTVTEVWAGVTINEDGSELIHNYIGADGIACPLVSADESGIKVLRSIAEKDAKRMKKKIEIRKYTSFETVDVITGDPVTG